MGEDEEQAVPVDISTDEISHVRQYILSKNTAVLTVMFTDIQGFTDVTELRGETYSKAVRERHDKILLDTIQEGGAGLVVKFIGDAVMAVFSEPSVAVERALLIQQRLREFNASQDEFEEVLVRIGLHMGQVAVEDAVQTDVFGRHVNRAARIESLASGGQIYLTYGVFDSARGWLASHADLQWHLHGDYLLKGIEEPVAIYEVCGPGFTPRAPQKGQRKKRGMPGLMLSIALVLIGGMAAAAYNWYQATEVWLERFYPEKLHIDGGPLLVLEGEPQDPQRQVRNPVSKGRHILHYDIDDSIRYYAEVEVDRGVNVLQPKFVESRLPKVYHAHGIGPDTELAQRRMESQTPYFYYDAAGQRQEIQLALKVEVDSERLAGETGRVQHTLRWQLLDQSKVLHQGEVTDTNNTSSSQTVRRDPVVFLELPPVRFYYRYRMRGQYIYVEAGGVFEEYRPG